MSDPTSVEYDLSIVYAQADLSWAKQLQARLATDGFRAALEDYLPGDIIIHTIEEVLTAARTCVFVYSRSTHADRWMAAKYQALLAAPDAYRFIPALIEDVPLDLFAAARAPLDFRGEDQEGPYLGLLLALRGRRPDEAPLPTHRLLRPEGAMHRVLRLGLGEVSYGLAGQEPRARHEPGPLTHALERRLWQLERARTARTSHHVKGSDLAEHPGALLTDRLVTVGRALGETFLSGAAGDALAADLAEARRSNSTLRLGLQVEGELAELPWETLLLPHHDQVLVLDAHTEMFRQPPTEGPPPAIAIKAPLRILAVIAAPEGPDAGPLLHMEDELRLILDAVDEARRHAAAHVRILNQGTLAAITQALKQERFHVLHISCHAKPGVLLLENAVGGVHEVTAQELATAINPNEGVPLVVLSGCSTALDTRTADKPTGSTEEKTLIGLARGLLDAGVPAVLAMTTSVTDRYASLLTGALYQELAIRPRPEVLTALSQARHALEQWRRNQPPASPDALLAEWATPALFQRGPGLPLYDIGNGVERVQAPYVPTLDRKVIVRRVGDFVGRRTELRILSSVLRGQHPFVVLHGTGGVGKSTLAAELLAQQGVAAGLVISLVGRTSPDQILTKAADKILVATAALGASAGPLREISQFLRRLDFPWQIRLEALAEALAQLPADVAASIKAPPLTLLLDNFEDNLNLRQTPSFLDEELAAFLTAWTQPGSPRKLIVTSRYPVPLPSDARELLTVLHVGPLLWAEARKLMWRLPGLDGLGLVDQRRAWVVVGGHPRTLEYLDAVLRGGRARFADVRERLEGLLERRGIVDPAGWLRGVGARAVVGGVDAVVAEAVTLAADDVLLADLLGVLPGFARRLLVGVSVYRRPVDRAGLVWPVSAPAPADPEDERRQERLGRLFERVERARETVPGAGLGDVGLSAGELEAARVDLAAVRAVPVVEPVGVDAAVETLAGLGLLAPAQADGGDLAGSGEGGFGGRPGGSGGDGFGGLAGSLVVVHRWTAASLADPGRTPVEEVRAAHVAAAAYWRWRVRTRPQDEQDDLLDMLEVRFHCHAAGDLDGAAEATDWVGERLHRWGAWAWEEQLVREMMAWFPDGSHEQAVIHHQLGRIAQDRGEYAQAETDYRRALTINEELGNQAGIAGSYHQLGRIAELRGEYAQAKTDYHRALTINEELGNQAGMATGYHQLGILAQLRGEYAQAETDYRRALTIKEELGNRVGMARSYHQLGMIAQLRGEYAQAETDYRRALTINEELGDRAGMATGYHQLGRIAELRGEYAQAETDYRRSLTIEEELGNQAGMATGYHQLGMIAQLRGEYVQAETDYRRALTIDEELGNRAGMASTISQVGVLYTETGRTAEAVACNTRALAIRLELQSPEAAIDLYWLARQRHHLGEERFRQHLAELLDTQSIDTLTDWLNQTDTEA
ncbi:tetratricopeptide repeat protein [Nonomuraea glycinis]|uniref:Tetratricopeptide repeat protein n=1 Tax=Nonomuraea glycinis TaxID=2047744 RepID=A0A918A2Z9_9ACTN|nr:tetratricopeptide repeat protein [Nonomuraea glycinis]GGP01923.1 hypothetical protein GCM10012278_07100 [Nonomuraea glycinis]